MTETASSRQTRQKSNANRRSRGYSNRSNAGFGFPILPPSQAVRCNAICPGFFPTEPNRKLLDEQRVANIMNDAPTPRYGAPNEPIGAAILLLSKKAGSYMTGSAVYVDGGFTCSWF